jgi:hypothetical protein
MKAIKWKFNCVKHLVTLTVWGVVVSELYYGELWEKAQEAFTTGKKVD